MSTDDESKEEASTATNASELVGYWVWSREVENGTVVLEITEEDLVPAVGPSGWPDCPSGIICTHYGIRKLRFDEDGTLWYIQNVHTSSDYQYPGHYTVADDLVSYTFDERFSCAHPNDSDQEERGGYFTFLVEEGELWVSVRNFGGLPFFSEPPEEPERWIVFRRITEEQYENQYMIRICVGSEDDCHTDCFPERWGSY